MQPRTADPSTRRRIAGGDIIGSKEPGGSHAWRGIRYAAPPIGPLRWRGPRAVQAWTGVFEALQHGPMAPQYAGQLAPVDKKFHGTIVGDEDCLNLNVFAPSWSPDSIPVEGDRRPVMVWIHGGGLSVGTSATYDVLRNYAEQDEIIVVTVNYRLGVLGWFTHPALHVADAAAPHERSGNFGLLDLIAALTWVQQNIASFGGDPGKVTIFGESAGGQMVLSLLASPLAKGLFHRAIAQSPVADSFSVSEVVEPNDHLLEYQHASSCEVTARLWDRFSGCAISGDARTAVAHLPAEETAAFLRSLTPKELLTAFKPVSAGMYLAPRPARDGVVLPKEPLTQVFETGQWNRVPVIIGCNRDEYRTFMGDKPEHSRLLFGRLPILRDRKAYIAESSFLSIAWQAVNIDPVADAMLRCGHDDVWSYRFDWDEALPVPLVRPDILLGACHAMEMAFSFRDTNGEFDPFRVSTPFNRSSRVALARAMGDAWTSFAKSGVPRLPDGIDWSRRRINGNAQDSLVFDSHRDGGVRMARVRTNMKAVKEHLLTTPDIPSPDVRCRIYARLFLWAPLYRGHGDKHEYSQWCRRFGCTVSAEAFRPTFET